MQLLFRLTESEEQFQTLDYVLLKSALSRKRSLRKRLCQIFDITTYSINNVRNKKTNFLVRSQEHKEYYYKLEKTFWDREIIVGDFQIQLDAFDNKSHNTIFNTLSSKEISSTVCRQKTDTKQPLRLCPHRGCMQKRGRGVYDLHFYGLWQKTIF